MRIISQENLDALVQLDLLSFFSVAVLSKGMIMNELSRAAINREPRLLRAVGRHEQILARFGRVFLTPRALRITSTNFRSTTSIATWSEATRRGKHQWHLQRTHPSPRDSMAQISASSRTDLSAPRSAHPQRNRSVNKSGQNESAND